MPIDSYPNFHVHKTFHLRGESALNSSSSGPHNQTFNGEEDVNHHSIQSSGLYPSFGTVVGALDIDSTSVRSDGEEYRSASAPEKDNVFPPEVATESEFSSSPAHMFLSLFSPKLPSSSLMDEESSVAGYTLLQTLGHGGFSTVKKGQSATGDVVAIKVVKKADLDLLDDPEEAHRQLQNEIAIWKTLNHEHILPLFTTEHTVDADYFIMLYCPAGSLFDILKRDGRPALAQDDAGMMFRQIVRGLRYLHETAKLVHGDIKLENILVDETGMCRIGDFGLSRHFTESSVSDTLDCDCSNDLSERVSEVANDRPRRYTTISHASALRKSQRLPRHRNSTPLGPGDDDTLHRHFNPGSLPYAAPELLSPPSVRCSLHRKTTVPNPAQDMWALGVLLYALLSGRLPFNDNFEPRLQMKILHGVYELPHGIGHGAERVLRGCLERNISNRWSVGMVDEVAWNVGWGLAGDQSISPLSSPVDDLSHGIQIRRKSRSRSRARPYPDHFDPALRTIYASDSSGSVFSSSISRSRSRVSHSSALASTEHVTCPPITSSLSSSSNNQQLTIELSCSPESYNSDYSFSRSRGTLPDLHLSSPQPVPFVRSGSQSHSKSRSRTRSSSDGPSTPSDTGVNTILTKNGSALRGRFSNTFSSMFPVEESEEERPRGRRRLRDENQVKI